VLTAPAASAQLFDAVGFYAGVTLEEVGGRGLRWPEREAAARFPEAEAGPFELESATAPAPANGALRLGTFRSLWASPEVDVSPALKFLVPLQHAELSPADAERLGVAHGDAVDVAFDGRSVRAQVSLRAAVPAGSVFLAEATLAGSATALTNGEPRLVEVRPA